MRLTGGALKGKKVNPKGLGKRSPHGALRATSSKVREALFNIIGPRIKGAVFADLYAGSGTVGLEAMSREAGSLYFVEPDNMRARSLLESLEGCGCSARAHVSSMKAMDFLAYAEAEGLMSDIVFLDPPYGYGQWPEILSRLGAGLFLSDEAIVIAEHSKKESLPDDAGCLLKHKEYRYGDTVLTLYRMG